MSVSDVTTQGTCLEYIIFISENPFLNIILCFRFKAKLSKKYRDFPHSPLLHKWTACLTVTSAVMCACLVSSVVSDALRPHGLQSTRLLCPWDSPGENIGVGCHALLQEILQTQGSNPCLLCVLHCKHILYC